MFFARDALYTGAGKTLEEAFLDLQSSVSGTEFADITFYEGEEIVVTLVKKDVPTKVSKRPV